MWRITNREHSGSLMRWDTSMYYYYRTYGTLIRAVNDPKLLKLDGVMPSEESLQRRQLSAYN